MNVFVALSSFTQTDPNWGNFLYEAPAVFQNSSSATHLLSTNAIVSAASSPVSGTVTCNKATVVGPGTLHLIDFGAAKEFPAVFVREYMEMVKG
jgi:predicted unusual protein kinase regulating ubiquinone biosynthesis (AarF/ABC1/UbiB family)